MATHEGVVTGAEVAGGKGCFLHFLRVRILRVFKVLVDQGLEVGQAVGFVVGEVELVVNLIGYLFMSPGDGVTEVEPGEEVFVGCCDSGGQYGMEIVQDGVLDAGAQNGERGVGMR